MAHKSNQISFNTLKIIVHGVLIEHLVFKILLFKRVASSGCLWGPLAQSTLLPEDLEKIIKDFAGLL